MFQNRVKPSYLVFSSPFGSLMYNGNMSSDFRVMSGSSTRSVLPFVSLFFGRVPK